MNSTLKRHYKTANRQSQVRISPLLTKVENGACLEATDEHIQPWWNGRCFKDNQSRLLHTFNHFFDDRLTVESCIEFCTRVISYLYTSVRNGRECFCDGYFNAGAHMIPDSGCNMKCVGDQTQTCGGNWTRNFFYSGTFFSAPGMFNIKMNFIIINHLI